MAAFIWLLFCFIGWCFKMFFWVSWWVVVHIIIYPMIWVFTMVCKFIVWLLETLFKLITGK